MGVTTLKQEKEEIVFVKKGSVFTNSLIISVGASVPHKKIKATILKHKDKLSELGDKIAPRHQTNEKGRKIVVYDLSEQQSTFLITLLKNTESVINFKMKLVKSFFALSSELKKRKEIMPAFKIERRAMTDAIKELPESPHKHMKYVHYTNLLYLAVTGFTAKKLKDLRGFEKDASPQDYLTSDELKKIASMEQKIAVLIDSGLDFKKIKDIVNTRFKAKLSV